MSAVLDTTNVHLGHWVNWSLGNSVRGSTLTLTRRDGALFIAFLSMFVSFAGTRIWKIAAFSIHLSLSRNSPQDAVFHQRQAILRNSSTADEAFWSLVKVASAWRKSNNLAYRKVGPLAIISLVAGLAFAVAGVFSSQVSSAMGNEVLLSGHGCAWLNSSSFSDQDTTTLSQPYTSELIQDAAQRAQQCYVSNTSTENCQTFVKPSFPVSVTRNASCPFNQRICQSNAANLVLDTGYLDSHYDFGMNAPPEHRIKARYVLSCAPLVMENYSSVVQGATTRDSTALESKSNQQWAQYFYGRLSSQIAQDFTYQYPLNVVRNESDVIEATSFDFDYTIYTDVAVANNSFSEFASFTAIPELSRTDADTVLVFLSSNSVIFTSPVDDPWYSVHRGPFEVSVDTGPGTVKGWFADNPANVLGCTLQTQFCNPNLPHQQACGPLTSFRALINEVFASVIPPVFPPWRDQNEANRFKNFVNTWFSFSSDVYAILPSLGRAALSGRRNFLSGFQGALTHNQWQLDVEYWLSTQLATIQRAFAETVNGPKYPGLETHLWPPQNDIDREFCRNQKILSTNYTSFSTLGLVLTFVIGGIFIAVSYFVERILHWIQRKWRWHNYALTEWWINETLQLQSFVHEEIGTGTWTREISVVSPITESGERLATLDLSDPRRPRFKAPQPFFDKASTTESSEETLTAVDTIASADSSSHTSFARDETDGTDPDVPAVGQGEACATSECDHGHHGGNVEKASPSRNIR